VFLERQPIVLPLNVLLVSSASWIPLPPRGRRSGCFALLRRKSRWLSRLVNRVRSPSVSVGPCQLFRPQLFRRQRFRRPAVIDVRVRRSFPLWVSLSCLAVSRWSGSCRCWWSSLPFSSHCH